MQIISHQFSYVLMVLLVTLTTASSKREREETCWAVCVRTLSTEPKESRKSLKLTHLQHITFEFTYRTTNNHTKNLV